MNRCRLVLSIALVAGVTGPGWGAQESSGEGAAEESLRLPYTVQRIWFRTEKKKMAGDLTITADALEFTGRKRSLTVPMESIRIVSFGNMRGDVDTDWVVLSVVQGGVAETYGVRDGRKFGFGARTREIYDAVKLAVRTLSAAQYRASRGFKPYVEMDHQFTMAIPQDWSTSHLLLIDVEGLPVRGASIFSAIPIVRETEEPEVRRAQLAAVANGTAAAVVLERKTLVSGMTCSGFSPGGREKVLEWIKQIPPVIKRQPWTFDGLPTVTQATIDDCEGLHIVQHGRNHGDDEVTIDVYTVARGRTVFLFVLRSVQEEREPRTRILERLLAAFRFSAASGSP